MALKDYSSRSFENEALTTRPVLYRGAVKYRCANLSAPAKAIAQTRSNSCCGKGITTDISGRIPTIAPMDAWRDVPISTLVLRVMMTNLG